MITPSAPAVPTLPKLILRRLRQCSRCVSRPDSTEMVTLPCPFAQPVKCGSDECRLCPVMHLSCEGVIAQFIIRACWHRDLHIFVACPRPLRRRRAYSLPFHRYPATVQPKSRLYVSHVYISSPSCASRRASRPRSNRSVLLLPSARLCSLGTRPCT